MKNDIARERDRRPSFDVFVVCSILIFGGGWWHGDFIFFSDINRGKEETK